MMKPKHRNSTVTWQEAFEVWKKMGGSPHSLASLAARIEKEYEVAVSVDTLRTWRNRHKWDDKLPKKAKEIHPEPMRKLVSDSGRPPKKPTSKEVELAKVALMGTPVEEIRKAAMITIHRFQEFMLTGAAKGIESGNEAANLLHKAAMVLQVADGMEDGKGQREAETEKTDPEEFKKATLAQHETAMKVLESRMINVTHTAASQPEEELTVVEETLEERLLRHISQ